MASENKNENVMLTGQTAYFKKNGSMTNYGVITSDNQEVTDTYGPGFIDEGSTVGIAKLETAQDYIDTLKDMRLYLGDDFVNESEDYLVKTNAENISNELSTRNTALQNIVSHIDKYTIIPYIKTKTTGTRLDMLIPLHLEENFVLEIKSDLQPINGESYMLIDNGDTFQLSQNSEGAFFLNGVNIGDLSHTTGTTMVISQEDGRLYIEKDMVRVVSEVPGFEGETDIVLNTQFASRIDEIKVYGDTGVTYELMPRYDTELKKAGLHDLQNNLWYTSTNPIILHGSLYSRVDIWYGALDLGYVPGPNTGIEIQYAQYSGQSTGTGTFRGIIGCYSEASITGTVHFGILLGSGSRIYATRNNNIRSWTDSGVANTTSGTSNFDIITVNKNNDGRFKCSGVHNFDKALSGTVTQTGPKGNTLWLNGFNDLGQYIPLEYINNQNLIRGGQNDIYIGYVKIYEGNELVRYYIPGYDLNNNKGMYDIVEQKMYKAVKCSFNPSGNIIDEPPLE